MARRLNPYLPHIYCLTIVRMIIAATELMPLERPRQRIAQVEHWNVGACEGAETDPT